jgi:tetratricopeptide (TPR) repeat protein
LNLGHAGPHRGVAARLVLALALALPWFGGSFHLAQIHVRDALYATGVAVAALVAAALAARERRGPRVNRGLELEEEERTPHEHSTSTTAENPGLPDPGGHGRLSPLLPRPDAALGWIAALAGLGSISSIWSATPRSTWLAATPWIATWMAAWLLGRAGWSWERPGARRAALCCGAALAAAGMASFVVPFAELGGAVGCGPFGGSTTAATCAALLLVLVLPGAAGTSGRSEGRRERLWSAAASAFLALWLLLLGVRAAWIAAAVGVVCTGIGAGPSPGRRHLLGGALAFFALLLLLPIPLFPAGGPRGGLRTPREELCAMFDLDRDSGGERLLLWRNGLELVARSPWLGLGLGRLRDEYPTALESGALHTYTSLDVHRTPRHIHLDPLEIWIELGPLGLALWLGAAGAIWRGTRRAPASRAVLAVFATAGLLHSTVFDPTALALLGPALAAPAALARGGGPGRSSSTLVPLAALLGAPLVLGATGSWLRVASDRDHDAALRALAADRTDEATARAALARSRRAVALDPEDTEKLLGLAGWLRRLREPEAALLVLAEAERTGPGSLARLGLAAEVWNELGRREAALECLDRLLTRQPQSREAHATLAHWAEAGEGPAAAWAVLERYVRAVPWTEDPRLWSKLGRERLRAHASFGAPRHLRGAEDALQRALAKPGLSPGETGDALVHLIDARLRMQGRDRPFEGLEPRLRSLWSEINPGEIRADLLGRLRILSATAESTGRADEARRLSSLVLELNAR